jgi:hypothetical protein
MTGQVERKIGWRIPRTGPIINRRKLRSFLQNHLFRPGHYFRPRSSIFLQPMLGASELRAWFLMQQGWCFPLLHSSGWQKALSDRSSTQSAGSSSSLLCFEEGNPRRTYKKILRNKWHPFMSSVIGWCMRAAVGPSYGDHISAVLIFFLQSLRRKRDIH